MRIVAVALGVIFVMVGLGWLLGPHQPAPALPAELLGSQATWLDRAEQISRQRRYLYILSLGVTPIALWLFVQFGWSAALRTALQTHGFRHPILRVVCFTSILVIVCAILNSPLNYVGLALRRSYGLSQEGTGAWLVRYIKEWGVTLALSVIGVGGLYWLIGVAPNRWGLWASSAYALFSLLLTYLAPYVITPLFFVQRPLEDQALRQEIVQLGACVGVPIDEVFVINASSQGNEGNAYFTGIGGSTRVVIYDTLLQNYPRNGLLTILAHELGHWREQHVWKSLLITWITAPVGLWLAQRVLGYLLPNWGIQDQADVAALPLLLLLITLGGLSVTPAQNWLSRRWEQAADQFSVQATGDPLAFQTTFVHLAQQNLSDPTPPLWFESLFSTHPAIGRRVAGARSVDNP